MFHQIGSKNKLWNQSETGAERNKNGILRGGLGPLGMAIVRQAGSILFIRLGPGSMDTGRMWTYQDLSYFYAKFVH